MTALCLAFAFFPVVAHGPAGYDLKFNLPYRAGAQDEYETERCKLDLYVPNGKKGFATVIWFHGGGLTSDEKRIPERLINQGFAVVAPNYRLSPKVRVVNCIEDAAAATAWTVAHIPDYGGSADKIFVSGHSAGGYLADMIVLDKRWLAPYKIDPDRFAGLVPFSGQAITHFTVRKERGIPDTQPQVDALAPLYYVRKDAPPILLLTGDREKEMLGRYEENAYFWRMLKVVGHKHVELVELKGYDHGGMPEPGYPHLIRFVNARSKEIDATAKG